VLLVLVGIATGQTLSRSLPDKAMDQSQMAQGTLLVGTMREHPLTVVAGQQKPLLVPLTVMLTVIQGQGQGHTVEQRRLLAALETANGETEYTYLARRMLALSVNCSAFQMIPPSSRPVSISPTTMTSPWRPRAMMYPSLAHNSRTHR
jgi:hypothetical protein